MKKITVITTILVAALMLSGCRIDMLTAPSGVPNNSESSQPNGVEVITPGPVAPAPSARLTGTEAETVALKHAGFAAEQVKGLRSEYDFDDGVLHYNVEFRVGQWEYEYEIHAETGAVLSFEKDD